MANRRVIDHKDTPTRIAETWAMIMEQGRRPTVTAFARLVGIDPAYFCRSYKPWADKVRQRRDAARSTPRTRSPASLPKADVAGLKDAMHQLTTVRRAYASLHRQYEVLRQEHDRLVVIAARTASLTARQERYLGLFMTLHDQLELVGLPAHTIRTVWEAMRKGLRAVQSADEQGEEHGTGPDSC